MRTARLLAFLLACTGAAFASQLPPDVYPGLRGADGKLLPGVAGHLGRDVRVLELPLDEEMVRRNERFGYSAAEIAEMFPHPRRVVLDESGLDRSVIAPPPAPGIHPRVLFNPDDLPGIRTRLDTQFGSAVMGGIRKGLTAQLTGPSAKFGPAYEKLAVGEVPPDSDNQIAYLLMYEAFRCLVDADEAGGRKAASAITTFSQIVSKDLETARRKAAPGPIDLSDPAADPPRYDARTVAQEATREFSLGLSYDFAHGFMTPAQRDAVRAVLADATGGLTALGAEALPAKFTGCSYWNAWVARALFALAAIEGEPGFDAEAFGRLARTQTSFIDAMLSSGDAFEGWGKNFVAPELLVVLAKRDPAANRLGHTSLRAFFNSHLPAVMLPWGGGFSFVDSWGQSASLLTRTSDAVVYRAAFPSDPAAGWIFRQQVGKPDTVAKLFNPRHFLAVYDALLCAIFASDPPEESASREACVADRPLSLFCEDTGNLSARSSWKPDALYLGHLNRALAGGHPVADRSHFNLYSHGRIWSLYAPVRDLPAQWGPDVRSVVLADGLSPSTAEARCVDHREGPGFSLVATDLSNAWNFQTDRLVKAPAGTAFGAKESPLNAFRLHPSKEPWMNVPIGRLPDWYTSRKPGTGAAGGGAARADWYRRLSVKHAFRTSVLVRNRKPFVLVCDDVRLDDASHAFIWGMTLPPDVLLRESGAFASSGARIVLEEQTPAAGQPARRLLVCFLPGPSPLRIPETTETLLLPNGTQPEMRLNRLHVGCDAVDPGFRVLMFPHVAGDPLPEVTPTPDRSGVVIDWEGERTQIAFETDAGGRTVPRVSNNAPAP